MKMLLSVSLAVLVFLTPVLTSLPIGIGAIAAEAQANISPMTVPVAGEILEKATGAKTPTEGTFAITKFVAKDGKPYAVGRLVISLPDGSMLVRQVAMEVQRNAVSIAQAECEILTLVLGPLDLDLLGLVIHLDQVVLTITAEPGPGNLLGNLLCAIAGLLDPSGSLTQLIALLNQLLTLLSQL